MTLDEQIAYLKKGSVDLITEPELRSRLEESARTGRALTVKVGFDPTAPDLHLGHTVLIRKMKHFQDLGHRVIFLIGDFTGLIGDPTGRSKTRPALTPEQILANAETYKNQVFKILDPDKTVVDFNSRWLSALKSEEWVRLCSRITVARMIERDDFAKRLASQIPIALHELLYSLAQAYDSVFLRADVEMGGTDQKFNLLVGRDIQREYGQPPQIVLTTPLLEGTDGVQKMSKSLDNYIGIQEEPREIYGKVMSTSDELMFRYYELLTDLSLEEIKSLRLKVASGQVHPMRAKADLASAIVRDFHGQAAAGEAARHFESVFQNRQMPDEVLEQALPPGSGLVDALARFQLAPSKTEARRLVVNGAVSVDGQRVSDVTYRFQQRADPFVVRCGKHQFLRLRVG
ncbi:MAG: tyrosine--tRNA ligase [Acidobacteriota bacterium]